MGLSLVSFFVSYLEEAVGESYLGVGGLLERVAGASKGKRLGLHGRT